MKTYELVGIGNAVVDVITQTDDSFLGHMGIEKGIMQLVEQDPEASEVYQMNFQLFPLTWNEEEEK